MAENDVGRHGYGGESPAKASTRQMSPKDLVVGEVVMVRPQAMTMDIELRDSNDILSDVRVALPSMGRMGAMGTMPEKGSLVVLARTGGRAYVPVAYLPPDPIGGKSYRVLKKADKGEMDPLSESGRIFPTRIRDMAEGDAIMSSSLGAGLYADSDVELQDSMGNEIRVRSSDGAILSTSRNNHLFAHGVWRSAGLIQRNSLHTRDGGEDRTDIEFRRVPMADGRETTYVGGDYLRYGSELYSEYRVEVGGKDSLHHPVNDINSAGNLRSDAASRRSTFVLGNYVGNDPADDSSYGRFLAPNFLYGGRLTEAGLRFSPLGRVPGQDVEYDTKGVSWALEHKGKSFLGSDKEGSVHRYMSAGTGPANAGWAMTTVMAGARRDVFGREPDTGLSWKALMHGGLDWEVGSSAEGPMSGGVPAGLRVRARGAAILSFNGGPGDFPALTSFDKGAAALTRPDIIRYGKIERVKGSSREEVSGDMELRVGGDYLWEIAGRFNYRIAGSFGESVFGDRTISTTAAFSVNSSEVKTTTGSRSTKIVAGDDDIKMLKGDSKLSIALGGVSTKLAVGSIEESVGVGSRKSSLAAGSFEVKIGVGNASVTTKAGNIEYTTAAGVATLGGVTTTLKGTTAVRVDSPFVSIGQGALSGVVTMLSHQDYITGLPLRPSLTVVAAL